MSLFSSTTGKVLGLALGGALLWGASTVFMKRTNGSSSKTMTVTAPNGLFLRAQPSQSSDRLALLQNGDQVTLQESGIAGDGLGGGWSKVVSQGNTGYVSSDWITDAQVSSSALSPSSPASPEPQPSSPGASDPSDPGTQPAPSTPSASLGPMYLTDPLVLVPGKHYRARLALNSFMEKAAPASAIASQFQGLGFSNVVAYMDSGSLPADWPSEMRANSSGAKTAWVEGDFQGQTATRVDRPAQIDKAWT